MIRGVQLQLDQLLAENSQLKTAERLLKSADDEGMFGENFQDNFQQLQVAPPTL